jgi:hypothetical protein
MLWPHARLHVKRTISMLCLLPSSGRDFHEPFPTEMMIKAIIKVIFKTRLLGNVSVVGFENLAADLCTPFFLSKSLFCTQLQVMSFSLYCR